MNETCDRHEGVKAVGTCHSCGKSFCADCLSEGLEDLYCSNAECQARMARDDGLISERNEKVDAEISEMTRAFDSRMISFLVGLWVVAMPLFIYLGSNGWTTNVGLASVMGVLGALVLCLQLRTFINMYKRRTMKRRRVQLISEWEKH